ncbi:MAG: ABC transporter ATP-binding protein [Bacillota bacterium]|nr:ABC transporter ATP-binding protein [Bacillota bacterium]
MSDVLLSVKDLKTSFFTHVGEVKAVDGVSFEVGKGEAVALVGESGCGKSVTALSIMGLLSYPGKIIGGSIWFNGRELVGLPPSEMHKIRGNEISMVFQDPMTSLNPVLTIRQQLAETLILHQKLSRREAGARAVELLRMVGIPSPERRVNQYPHQFSGGMRQRVMIAMALSCNPKLLIADEPTTALDVTIQAQILELMKELKQRFSTSIILITHDLGVVAGLCNRVIVMYAGKIIEQGPLRDIYYNPQHPYTWGLLKSVPRLHDTEKRRLVPIVGQPPDLLKPPPGCSFHPRCAQAMGVCLKEQPPYFEVDGKVDHRVACWLLHPQAAPHLSRITQERMVR